MTEITDQLWMRTPDGSEVLAADIPVFSCDWWLEENKFHKLVATGSYGGADDINPELFVLDARFEIHRFIDGVGLGIEGDTQFFLRFWDYGEDETGVGTWTIEAYSPEYFIQGRIIDSWASSDDRTNPLSTKTGDADDVIKAFVNQNIGPGTTLTARLIEEITMEDDESLGPAVEKSAGWANLFETLEDISEDAENEGDWVSWGLVASGEGAGFEFRTWVDYRGVDRTSDAGDAVLVSKDAGNLLAARVFYDHREELTAIRALGKGEDKSRMKVRVEDEERSGASPWAYREGKIECQAETIATLRAEAKAELQRRKPIRGFTGKMLDTDSARYGRDVKFGDLVTAEAYGRTFTCRLRRISGSWGAGIGETLTIELSGQEAL